MAVFNFNIKDYMKVSKKFPIIFFYFIILLSLLLTACNKNSSKEEENIHEKKVSIFEEITETEVTEIAEAAEVDIHDEDEDGSNIDDKSDLIRDIELKIALQQKLAKFEF